LWPQKFNNKTNGITPRRWLLISNPPLSRLISEAIGEGWITDLQQLRKLEPLAQDASFRESFRKAKRQCKEALAGYISNRMGISIAAKSMSDVQVKRLNE